MEATISEDNLAGLRRAVQPSNEAWVGSKTAAAHRNVSERWLRDLTLILPDTVHMELGGIKFRLFELDRWMSENSERVMRHRRRLRREKLERSGRTHVTTPAALVQTNPATRRDVPLG